MADAMTASAGVAGEYIAADGGNPVIAVALKAADNRAARRRATQLPPDAAAKSLSRAVSASARSPHASSWSGLPSDGAIQPSSRRTSSGCPPRTAVLKDETPSGAPRCRSACAASHWPSKHATSNTAAAEGPGAKRARTTSAWRTAPRTT